MDTVISNIDMEANPNVELYSVNKKIRNISIYFELWRRYWRESLS